MFQTITNLKRWYLKFLNKKQQSFPEKVFYCFLYFLSFLYGCAVNIRNFLYAKKLLPVYTTKAKVISVGNLCWSGSGKTSFCIWLYQTLSTDFKTAILRRGYGADEGRLLKEAVGNVYEGVDRAALARKLEAKFEVFILDDGFQHRRLGRNIDIVVMGAREFRKKYALLPAAFFREPLTSLKRAAIVILNYADEIPDILKVKRIIWEAAPKAKIYPARYRLKGFRDAANKEILPEALKDKKLAAFCAVGYPEGFFNQLTQLGLNVVQRIAYPDHYQFSRPVWDAFQDALLKKGVDALVVTAKDKYRFPAPGLKIKILVMEVELEIEGAAVLCEELKRCIT